MTTIRALTTWWKQHLSYERFEHTVTRIIMLFVGIVIVYTLVLVGMELAVDFRLGPDFVEKELLQDIFGSILTVLILLEFNHSIAVALARKSGVIQVRIVVLIAILVVARKLLLLDFKTATLDQLAGIGGVALALGILYWLIGPASTRHETAHDRATAER
jgi:uncharacterized membrane protein (DUF373 family)